MAAGLGFKTFAVGEILSAANVNGYLMQGVLVFANATARDAAITSPQEGQFAFTKDNDSLWYYSGSAWVASGATGDIEGVTAGTGISGGGTSGTVTITNSMATEIAAKGDLIVGTGSATFDNLTVGTNGHVLTADSTVSPTGLKWAAPAGGGGMTLLSTTTLSGSSTTITTDFTGYNSAYISISDVDLSANDGFGMKINNSLITYMTLNWQTSSSSGTGIENGGDVQFNFGQDLSGSTLDNNGFLVIDDPANTTHWKAFRYSSGWTGGAGDKSSYNGGGAFATTSAITSIVCAPFTGGVTFQGGTFKVYGVK